MYPTDELIEIKMLLSKGQYVDRLFTDDNGKYRLVSIDRSGHLYFYFVDFGEEISIKEDI